MSTVSMEPNPLAVTAIGYLAKVESGAIRPDNLPPGWEVDHVVAERRSLRGGDLHIDGEVFLVPEGTKKQPDLRLPMPPIKRRADGQSIHFWLIIRS